MTGPFLRGLRATWRGEGRLPPNHTQKRPTRAHVALKGLIFRFPTRSLPFARPPPRPPVSQFYHAKTTKIYDKTHRQTLSDRCPVEILFDRSTDKMPGRDACCGRALREDGPVSRIQYPVYSIRYPVHGARYTVSCILYTVSRALLTF